MILLLKSTYKPLSGIYYSINIEIIYSYRTVRAYFLLTNMNNKSYYCGFFNFLYFLVTKITGVDIKVFK